MIEFKNIIKNYPNFTLGPINTILNQGKFISVVGSSGSGKTTFVKLLTQNVQPDSGKIILSGITKQQISYISQIGTTFNHLTIRDNLNLKFKYSDETIIKTLIEVGLNENFIDKYPFQLSGGERQRIDLMRALLSNSKYIILDEAMSALDNANKIKISKLLHKLVTEQNITIVYITHDIVQAMKYSTDIIAIENGKIIYSGTANNYNPLHLGDDTNGIT